MGFHAANPAILPNHHGHEECEAKMAEKPCEQLKVPRKYAEFTWLVAEFDFKVHCIKDLRAGSVL